MADTQALMSHFGFDLTDLEANRRGTLSEKQRKELIPNFRPVYWVLAFGFLAGAGYLGWRALQSGINLNSIALPAILLLVALFFFRGATKSSRFASQVMAVTGTAAVSRETQQQANVLPEGMYYLRIGDRSFPIDQAGADLIEEGATYTAYSSMGSREFVSIERLD